MPYRLKRKGDLYFVVSEDGKKHSKKGLTKEMARKQLAALNIAYAREKGYSIPRPMEKNVRVAKSKVPNPMALSTAEQIQENVVMREARRLELEGKEKEMMSMKDRLDALKDERKAHKMEEKAEAPVQKKVDIEEDKLIRKEIEFAKMTPAKRRKLYDEYYSKKMKPEDVPMEARRGYKMYLKKK